MVLQEKNIKNQNSNLLQIFDYTYIILITGDTESGKTNALVDLMRIKQTLKKLIHMLRIHTN